MSPTAFRDFLNPERCRARCQPDWPDLFRTQKSARCTDDV